MQPPGIERYDPDEERNLRLITSLNYFLQPISPLLGMSPDLHVLRSVLSTMMKGPISPIYGSSRSSSELQVQHVPSTS